MKETKKAAGPMKVNIPFEGMCPGCREKMPAGSEAVYLPTLGMFHPACAEKQAS